MISDSIYFCRRLARQARRMGALARTPEDLWLLARMLGWALALTILKRAVPIAPLARLMWSEPSSGSRILERQQQVASVIGWIYGRYSLRSHCLERSLLLYRFLSKAAAEPQLVFGLEHTVKGWHGHAWILVNGLPFGESSDALQNFCQVLVFSEGGLAQSSSR